MTTVQEREALLAEPNGQNKAAIGPVLATGSIAKATERADGTMEATVRILQDALSFEPAIQDPAARWQRRADPRPHPTPEAQP